MGVGRRDQFACLVAAAAGAAALAAGPALSQPSGLKALGAPPCGPATQTTLTTDYHVDLIEIYRGELSGGEVNDDLQHIEGASDLGAALANGDTAATVAATTRIVYHRRWHIVRLRVLSTSGQVLADVGGPYILAPVKGRISYQGKVVGSFIMSVQDDLGYEKLVMRFTGLPIELYSAGKPLMGRDFPAADVPAHDPAEGAALTVAGVKSVADTYDVLAFPTGETRVLVAIPRATAALAADSCDVVSGIADGAIAVSLAKLVRLPRGVGAFLTLAHQFTPRALLFVRQGSTQIASSGGQPGPAAIPRGGVISYAGQNWFVYSFAPAIGLRVSVLYPLGSPTTGPTGASGSTQATGADN